MMNLLREKLLNHWVKKVIPDFLLDSWPVVLNVYTQDDPVTFAVDRELPTDAGCQLDLRFAFPDQRLHGVSGDVQKRLQ